MAESSAVPSSTPRSRVVRSLARAAERPCARPSCPAPARATLTFSYATAEVHLDRLVEEVDPQGYDLCSRHAARTEAPRGWALTDRRPEDDRVALEPPPTPTRDLGSQATVAVLAAALRSVPTPPATRDQPSAPATDAVPATSPDREPGTARRRSIVETLLSPPPARDEEPAPRTVAGTGPETPDVSRQDTRHDPTVELPRMDAPRPVPAAGDRGPATDW